MAQCAETALHSAQYRQLFSECSVEPFKTLSRPKDRPTKSLRGSRGGERWRERGRKRDFEKKKQF